MCKDSRIPGIRPLRGFMPLVVPLLFFNLIFEVSSPPPLSPYISTSYVVWTELAFLHSSPPPPAPASSCVYPLPWAAGNGGCSC